MTLRIIQYAVAALALAALVAGEALSWGLSDEVVAILAMAVGWLGLRRPADKPGE